MKKIVFCFDFVWDTISFLGSLPFYMLGTYLGWVYGMFIVGFKSGKNQADGW